MFRGSAMPATGTSAPIKLLLILLPLLWLGGAACTDLSDLEEEIADENLADSLLSVTESRNVSMDLIEDGHRLVTIQTPFAATYHHEDRARTEMDGPVYVVVRDSLGNTQTEVNSNQATYWSKDSEFHFREQVRVNTDRGRTLRTESLNWYQEQRRINTDEFVIITTPSDSITGYGLNADEDLTNYTIRTVTGQFELN